MKSSCFIFITSLILFSCGTKQAQLEENYQSNLTQLASEVITSTIEETIVITEYPPLSELKKINENLYQSVSIEPIDHAFEKSINFYTWQQLDNERMKLIDVTNFDNFSQIVGYEIGQFYLNIWEENEAFYVSYKNIDLSDSFLKSASNGKLEGSHISIGTSEKELLVELGNPVMIDWYYGGMYYVYGEIGFIIDDNSSVVAICLPGSRMKTTLEEVELKLGAPTTMTYDEATYLYTYSYDVGNYQLNFEGYEKNIDVMNIWLLEKGK